MPTATKSTKNIFSLKYFSLGLLVLIALGGVAGSYYFYSKYQAVQTNPQAEAERVTADLVAAVGKLMELPADETPTIAIISDREALQGQTFFKAAQNGDRLLAYNLAMIAVLYRPSTNKIVNVAPITITESPVATPVTAPEIATPEEDMPQTDVLIIPGSE